MKIFINTLMLEKGTGTIALYTEQDMETLIRDEAKYTLKELDEDDVNKIGKRHCYFGRASLLEIRAMPKIKG